MNDLTKLQNAISKFNMKFGTDINAELFVYTTCIKVTLNYADKDTPFYFNDIKDAIMNIKQTYEIWLENE